MNVKTFPAMKVFFMFLLCPFFAGLIIGPIFLIIMFVDLFSDARLLGQVRGGEAFSILLTAPILGDIIFFIPSLVFASCITLLRPANSFKICRIISIYGGATASLWMFMADYYLLRNSSGYNFLDSYVPVSIAFVVGLLVTGGIAYWTLPKNSHGK
ncbi:hypothetical protein J2Y83_000047 [Pseudomonas marginalis]|uniref:hypothetical protein n=1 Tax=Pseudomonas marginalis TaxID=298 RepID=UPI0020A21DA5|nr:hypothetical protein [Pseudomonas marginalis]MCP1509920.1 hypothetical protein [Pseudomonas marginalis]MCP1521578.1 hypothetical protein [Pseudomonas marginalis]MDQ0502647.1 hypothetical protein [Pseudomonas marginalis]